MRTIKFRGKASRKDKDMCGDLIKINNSYHILGKDDMREDGHHITQDSDIPTCVDETIVKWIIEGFKCPKQKCDVKKEFIDILSKYVEDVKNGLDHEGSLEFWVDSLVGVVFPEEAEGSEEESEEEVSCGNSLEFAVGDWVVMKGGAKFCDNKRYAMVKKVEGIRVWLSDGCWVSDYQLRKWEISDARDGDFLVYDSEIFIFKCISGNSPRMYHCGYDGKMFIARDMCSQSADNLKNVRPATEDEIRTLLLKTIANWYAGSVEHLKVR